MKEIGLSQGQVALVDDEDFDRLNEFKWHAAWNPNTRSFYTIRNSPTVDGKQRTICLHRAVMAAKTGEYVDHINHDTLDNRRENLRVCSVSQNNYNTRMRVDNTSGFKGVSWNKALGKWRARLNANRKECLIGSFETALEAALAYDREALETFGKFALTNEKLGFIIAPSREKQSGADGP